MPNLKTWLQSRARKHPATGIVLHATAGASAASSISWLRQIGLSYHYVIERDGVVTKCVPLSRVAFHAGVSWAWGGANCNEYTIGICFANRNDGKEPYTAEQTTAALDLVAEIRKDKNIRWVTSHALCATPSGRKDDPKGYDMAKFAGACGLKLWTPAQR